MVIMIITGCCGDPWEGLYLARCLCFNNGSSWILLFRHIEAHHVVVGPISTTTLPQDPVG